MNQKEKIPEYCSAESLLNIAANAHLIFPEIDWLPDTMGIAHDVMSDGGDVYTLIECDSRGLACYILSGLEGVSPMDFGRIPTSILTKLADRLGTATAW